MKDLLHSGYEVNGVFYTFIIRRYICDAPAREFVKQIIGHTGYCSCEKCIVYGEYVHGRVTYTDLNADLRTDESFHNRSQPYHH